MKKNLLNGFILVMAFLSVWSAQAQNPNTCTAPAQVAAYTNNTGDGAVIFWSRTAAPNYTLRYRLATDSNWTVIENIVLTAQDSMGFRLTGLQPCRDYVFQVRSNCPPNGLNLITSGVFRTAGCVAPCAVRGLMAVRDSAGNAILRWEQTASNYIVRYKKTSERVWTSLTTTGTTLLLNNLSACTEYDWAVKAVCSPTSSSDFVAGRSFKTAGCAPVCAVPRLNNVTTIGRGLILSWLPLGTRTFEVQYRLAGDSAWTRLTVAGGAVRLDSLATCALYQVRLRAVCTAPNTTTAGVFSDWSTTITVRTTGCVTTRCEMPRRLSYTVSNTGVTLRWDSAGVGARYELQWKSIRDSAWTTVSGLTVPAYNLGNLAACTGYMFRVRTACANTTAASDWSYPVRFTSSCATPCGPMPVVSARVLNDSMVFVSFAYDAGATYRVRYRVLGEATWQNMTSTGQSMFDTRACTTYEVQLVRTCGGAVAESPIYRVVSGGCTSILCTPPANIVVAPTVSGAVLTWEGNSRDSFMVEYRRAGDSMYVNTATSNNRLVLANLLPCTQYVVILRRFCNGQLIVVEKTFRTLGANCFGEGNTGSGAAALAQVSIYPNPGSSYVQVAYTVLNEANVSIELVNAQGQTVQTYVGGLQEAGNYVQTLDNLSPEQTGFYWVVVRGNGQVLSAQKWLKQ